LGTSAEDRLLHRANKSRSRQLIVPAESITCRETIPFLKRLLPLCGEGGCSREAVLWTVAERLLARAGILSRPGVQEILCGFGYGPEAPIPIPEPPSGERDLLGIVYQFLLPEGEKNRLGSYYTPSGVAERMLAGWELRSGEALLDPCCGSGTFLLSIPCRDPEQLWGCDLDPVAVFLARINLLCRFPARDFSPRVFCCDYLEGSPGEAAVLLRKQRFRWIATNPPWGAETDASGEKKDGNRESFSRFFLKAWDQLLPEGKIAFLFPEAMLSVRKHRMFRSFLTEQCRLEKIVCFDRLFSGVMTRYLALRATKAEPQNGFSLVRGTGGPRRIALSGILRSPERRFVFLSPGEERLREKIESRKHSDLRGSRFALGIVTGDNARYLADAPGPGREPIFTGKEVRRYRLEAPRKYLRFAPERFQQTAPPEYYRAPEKLLYRFIADQPVFALDTSRSLCLNSVNILIPAIPGMSIRTVLAFLDSALFRWYYRVLFGGVKVLKGSLQELPFPEITPEQDQRLSLAVERILAGDLQADAEIQKEIFAIYALRPAEIRIAGL